MKQGLSNLFGTRSVSLINDGDKERVNDYFRVLDETGDKALAYQSTLNGASNATKQIALTSANATVAQEAMANATTKVTLAEKAAAVGAKALGVALNTAFNVVASLAISLAIKGITKLINAEKEARERAVEIAEAYKSEQQENDKLVRQYVEIAAITTNLTNEKDKLLSIQEKLNENVSDQKKQYDLLNGSLAENLKLAREQEYQNAKRTMADLQIKYEEATELYNYKTESAKKIDYNSIATPIGGLPDEIVEKLPNIGEVHTKRDVLDMYTNIINEYSQWESKNNDILESLTKARDDIEEKVLYQEEIITQYESAQKIVESQKKAETAESDFNKIIDQIDAKQRKVNELLQSGDDPIALASANNDLKELISNLYNVANGYNGLEKQADEVSESISKSLNIDVSASSNSIKDFASVFSEYLDSSFKDTLSNVDKVESAMQTLANGDSLDWETFKELNWDIDVDHILGAFNQVDDGYTRLNGDLSDLIKLKDAEVLKQKEVIQGLVDEQRQAMEVLKANLALAKSKFSRSNSESDAAYYRQQIQDIESEIKQVYSNIKDCDIIINHLNSRLGDTVDYTEALENQVEKIQEEADKYANAMLAQIDNIIESHESEKDVLDREKEALEEQMDILEEQQDAIEEIIDNYKTVADIVESVAEKEIDLLKEQQEAEEAAIQAKIDALKEAHEQQEEENSLIEKELTLQQKLRDLEKAKQTKVRTYSEARGWHYGTDKEAVVNAQTAVDEAQSDYDTAISDKIYNDQLDALEKEKELIAENYEDQIKAYEDYYKQWKSIVDEQEEAENEQLAQQILGVEWREKIKNKDTEILNKFSSNFRGYNSQLNQLINNEIANLKLSIKAKEDEIKAKEKQIQSWKDYKTQVEKSINDIKGKYDEYLSHLDAAQLTESSTYEERANALENFVNKYQDFANRINYLQSQMPNLDLTLNTNLDEVRWKTAEFLTQYRDGVLAMQEALANSATGFGIVNSQWDADLVNAANYARSIDFYGMMGFASGGTADSTGLAMLHGTKQKAETIFNAEQSKRLYDMVKTDSFSNLVAQRAVDGITRALGSNQTINNSSNVGSTIHIHEMVIKADNPTQFHDQFIREIGQYWKIKLAENRVK